MLFRTKFSALLAVIAVTAAVSPLSYATMGAGSGGGGNGEKLKVFIVAQRALNSLRTNQTAFPEVRASDLKTMLESAKIELTDEPLYLDGIPVDAINTPETKTIVINRPAWKKMRIQPAVQVSFIAHEMLSLMRVERTDDYKVSSRLAGYVVSEAEPVFKWSCAAVYMERANPNSTIHVIGEGNTAAEAWKDLLDSAYASVSYADGIFVKSVGRPSSQSIQVNMADACVRN